MVAGNRTGWIAIQNQGNARSSVEDNGTWVLQEALRNQLQSQAQHQAQHQLQAQSLQRPMEWLFLAVAGQQVTAANNPTTPGAKQARAIAVTAVERGTLKILELVDSPSFEVDRPKRINAAVDTY